MSETLGTIIQLARGLLAPVFVGASWNRWFVLLKALFGLSLTDDEKAIYTELTHRQRTPAELGQRIREAWFIFGRRAGKSIIAALIAVFLSTCRTYRLAPGERGIVVVISADRRQSRVTKRYISGLLHAAAVLKPLVAKETKEAIELTNGLSIEIHSASFKTLRGYTVVGAICDEIAFWPNEDAASPDREILAALRPAMASVPEALLVCITSPYAKRGETWRMYREHFGKDDSSVLVAQAPTRTMNPTVDQGLVDDAMAADPAHAAAEYLAQFRADIEAFIDPDMISACVVAGRHDVLPVAGEYYVAFVDVAGGSSGGDSFALAIAHQGWRDGQSVVVIDALREVKPPCSAEATVGEFVALLKTYGVYGVVGDHYAGEWPAQLFAKEGIGYEVSRRSASEIFRDALPLITSRRIELPDSPRLITQLGALERRTSWGGRDSIGHSPSGHDDIAVAVCGAALCVDVQAFPAGVSNIGRALTNFDPYPDLGRPGRLTPWEAEAETQQWLLLRERQRRGEVIDVGGNRRAIVDFDPYDPNR